MAYRRRREPAVLSALYLAFILGTLGYAGFNLGIRRRPLLEDLTLRENLIGVSIVLGLWLIFWPLIALRRRGDR